ncbi:hypothetical protein [Kribbella sp. CA-247076]|uniref:hypothetical protein n=1 Tax=Kribbella sp. CA-247076 TaxID=3239941 RepID=UPI003D8CA720
MAARGPEIRLAGGPGDGQVFTEADFEARILAARRMRRTTPIGPGWALGYRRPASGLQWTWADGQNCHPLEGVDPALLKPYGSFLRDGS